MSKVGTPIQYFPATTDGVFSDSNDLRTNNFSIPHGPVAGVITTDWSSVFGGEADMCNLTLFPDYGAPVCRGSIHRKGLHSIYEQDGKKYENPCWDYLRPQGVCVGLSADNVSAANADTATVATATT